jgi:hypothetical protein
MAKQLQDLFHIRKDEKLNALAGHRAHRTFHAVRIAELAQDALRRNSRVLELPY